MKKIIKGILAILISVVIIVGIFLAKFLYETEYRLTNIAEYINPDNNYAILFQSVGEPFLFGPAKVKITLLDENEHKIEVLAKSISNDGGRAGEDSIKVDWFDNYVEITLSGCEQQDETCRINYN